jgi:hypothetical protein
MRILLLLIEWSLVKDPNKSQPVNSQIGYLRGAVNSRLKGHLSISVDMSFLVLLFQASQDSLPIVPEIGFVPTLLPHSNMVL